MPKGISLNIGINSLKVGPYRGQGLLKSPENDARAMAGIAITEGYLCPTILLTEQATRSNFISHLKHCIQILEPGDTFLLSFSGHGGQIADTSRDEADGKDETWCFYDGHLIDDEIGELWQQFKKGVRITVVSSSCHSRTALRVWDDSCFNTSNTRDVHCRSREITTNAHTILTKHLHDPLIKADIIHLSACEDKQRAQDGAYYSHFTHLLLKSWDYGRFSGSYQDMVKTIELEAGYTQKPGLQTMGVSRNELALQHPFKLKATNY